MKIGSKEYYMDGFKHVMMTNLITSKSQSLSSTHSYYEDQIENFETINKDEKNIYLDNLQKAFDDIVHEVLGRPEE